MKYAGIDIGKYVHCMGAINPQGQCVSKPWMFEQTQERFEQLEQKLRQLGTPQTLQIGLEATGHYWVVLHDFLIEQGWSVQVFNPLLSAHQAKGNLRGRRTDEDACLVIAKVIRDGGFMPFVTASTALATLKPLCRQRQYLAHQSANAKRRLGALVDQVFPEFAKHFSDAYGKGALEILKAFPSAHQLAQGHLTALTTCLHKASRGRLGKRRAQALREAARTSVACPRKDNAIEIIIPMIVEHLQYLQTQIDTMNGHIAKEYQALEHPVKSIPGMGSVVSPIILAELGDMNRFQGKKAAHKMLAYAGLDPCIRRSGKWQGKIKMSKRGSSTLRTALYQAAHTVRLHCPAFAVIYERHKRKGKHHAVALSHVARKLLQVIRVITLTNQTFDPAKIGQISA